MSLLVESVKLKDGRLYNIDFHSDRFNRTRRDLFGTGLAVNLEKKIIIPAYANRGLFKCRIEYDDNIRNIEFTPYELKQVNTLRLVEAGDLEYSYKFINRNGLNELYDKRLECDDILIVKNGFITDTSYSNIVVSGKDGRWYTPSSYLLAGTKRAYLLNRGFISEREITPVSLRRYKELRLINSMLDIGDTEGIPVKTICF